MNKMPPIKNYVQMQAKREVATQILFALKTYENINIKGNGGVLLTFSSIHSFLTHSANISKLLWSGKPWAKNKNIKSILGSDLGDVLGVIDFPLLKDKSFRDDLDHYDERLVEWIEEVYPTDPAAPRRVVNDLSVGTIVGTDTLYLRHYDPTSTVYTFGDRKLNLGALHEELVRLQKVIGGVTVKE